MELFYHVFQLRKGKECRFRFHFSKNGEKEITGIAAVGLKSPYIYNEFDEKSGMMLDEADKRCIISSVLRNLVIR